MIRISVQSVVGALVACGLTSLVACNASNSTANAGGASGGSRGSGGGGPGGGSDGGKETSGLVDGGTGGKTNSTGGHTGAGGKSDAATDSALPGDGGEAGTGTPPVPVLCPEADLSSPKLSNSVLITDAILQADATWTADKVYLVTSNFEISKHALTIEAGTTICLGSGVIFSVGQVEAGEIHVRGSAAKHVTFTAAMGPDGKTPAFSGGISINQWGASTIAYLDVWYAGIGGGGATWAFSLESTSEGADPSKPFRLDHVTVGAAQTRGIAIRQPIEPTSSLRLTGYYPPDANTPPLGAAMSLSAYANVSASEMTIDAQNIPADAKFIELYLSSGLIAADATLVDLGLPYRYTGPLSVYNSSGPNASTLTIAEGVTLALDDGIVIGDPTSTSKGNLVLAGSAGRPVTLTSFQSAPAAGDWNGLYFATGAFDPSVSKIDHGLIAYAGNPSSGHGLSGCGTERYGAIAIDGTGAYQGPPITNTTIAHSKASGIVGTSSSLGDHLTNDYSSTNSFQDIASGKNVDTAACP